MKIVRYTTPTGALVGYLDGELVVPVGAGNGPGGLATVLDLAAAANADPAFRPPPSADPVELAAVQLLAPIDQVPSIRDFYAFEQHVRTARRRRGLDMHPDWYELPVFYFSNPAAVVGPDEPVAVPARTAEMDYELEVAAILGRGGRNVGIDEATDLIAGFTVMNDWSARDVQRREMQLSMGPVKGKDFATSLGPCLVTRAEFAPGGLRDVPSAPMLARVNGVEYSRSDLDTLWWSFAEMVVYAAENVTLRPGDVVGSGTCGTGCILELALTAGNERYPWLKSGDVVELEVGGIGVLRNPLVAADGPAFAKDAARVRPTIEVSPESAESVASADSAEVSS